MAARVLKRTDEEDDIPIEVVIFHHLSNMYKWSWETYWEHTPMLVIKWLTALLEEKTERGFLSHAEMSHYKNLARQGGFRGYDGG